MVRGRVQVDVVRLDVGDVVPRPVELPGHKRTAGRVVGRVVGHVHLRHRELAAPVRRVRAKLGNFSGEALQLVGTGADRGRDHRGGRAADRRPDVLRHDVGRSRDRPEVGELRRGEVQGNGVTAHRRIARLRGNTAVVGGLGVLHGLEGESDVLWREGLAVIPGDTLSDGEGQRHPIGREAVGGRQPWMALRRIQRVELVKGFVDEAPQVHLGRERGAVEGVEVLREGDAGVRLLREDGVVARSGTRRWTA